MKKLWLWNDGDSVGYYITDPTHTPGGYKLEFVGEVTDQQAHLLLALVPECVSEDK